MVIAIQGIKQSFHAIAAYSLFGDSSSLNECLTFNDVFLAVKNSEADYGVVAIENSLYGSINDTYDLLVKNNLYICGETYEQISLHLLGAKTSELNTVSDVYSHPAALGESTDFLDTKLPHARRHEYSDTALAAKFLADSKDPTKAAIAGSAAAEAYGLKYLSKNIESHSDNYTRFIAISKKLTTPKSNNLKSSIVFQTADSPGSLHAALGVFAQSNINMTKLESRPIIGRAWRYMYYVDISAEFTDEIKTELSKFATEIRLLGCYIPGSMSSI